MKRILHISKYMYPFIGGTEQVARDVISVLKEMDVVQKVICFNEDAVDENYICKRRETVTDNIDGIEIIRCGCVCKIFSQSLSFTYAKELEKVMDNFRPDIIFFHYPNPFVAYFLLKQKKNFKFVLYWHLDITKQKLLGRLFHKQSMELLKRADKVIVTSPNYLEGSSYLRRYREKCTIISNSIHVDRFEINSDVKKKAEEIRNKYIDKTICFAVGRHVSYKGYMYLLEAGKYLNDNFKILIGGQGPLTKHLKRAVKNDERFEFCGKLSNEEMTILYFVCDIFCFPSITKNEAFGIALAEGMSFGKPAITFTIAGSGVNYVNLDGITGIECPNRNAKAYAKAIMQLSADNEMRNRMGRNAQKRVQELFVMEQFSKRISELMISLE